MKNILTLLFFSLSTVCFAQWATNDYACKIETFDSTIHRGTRVQIIDYKTDSTLHEFITSSDGGISGYVEKLVYKKKYKLIASKNGYRNLTIDSVRIINPWGQVLISWPTQFNKLLPLAFIPISDTLSTDLKSGHTYVITKDVVVAKNISIERRVQTYFFGTLILSNGVTIMAKGVKSDSVFLESYRFKMQKGSKIDLSYCQLSDFSIETNSDITSDTNTQININYSYIENSTLINGKKLNVRLAHNRFINSQIFSVDSLVMAHVDNNELINSSFGKISNTRRENEFEYDDTDELRYTVIIDKNVFKSDLSFIKGFIQNINSGILFTNNKIESYKFNPISIQTDQHSLLVFINNEITGSFDVSASNVTGDDTYNGLLFVGNNITLNGYSSIKNNGVNFNNNLLNLNTFQMTVHGVHDGCPCVETTFRLTSNTIVGGRLWFNTSTNGGKDAFMEINNNIVNAEIVTSRLSGTGNVFKKDLFLDYFQEPKHIIDDETMEGWVYHHDKNEIFDGSNLYVDSDQLLNNTPPFYHGTSPFLYHKGRYYSEIGNQAYPYEPIGEIGYNPTGTTLDSLFPEYRLPTCIDTCSISGGSNKKTTPSSSLDPRFYPLGKVVLTNKQTGEIRISVVDYNGEFKFSYLSKGEYIAQLIPNAPFQHTLATYSTFYVSNTSNPKNASQIVVEGQVSGIDLFFPYILSGSTISNVSKITGNISYQDLTISDEELAYRFNYSGYINASPFAHSAQYLPVILRDGSGNVVYSTNTDNKGSFEFPKVAIGTYTIESQRYGYKLASSNPIIVSANGPSIYNDLLVKDDEPTGIVEENDIISLLPSVMPNPFKDNLTIQSVNMNAFVQISDATGKVIYDQKTDNFITTINTSNWQNGVYIVRTAETTVKVVK